MAKKQEKASGLSSALDFIMDKMGKENEDIVYTPGKMRESCTSGSVILDSMTGVGGFLVKKKLVEIAAPESAGKTTLCLLSCAEAQKRGWVGVYMDVEQAFDDDYAKALGVKLDGETFAVVRPTYAEEAEKALNYLLQKIDIDYLIIDSVAAMKPESQVYADDSTGKGQVKGLHAMFWSGFAPKLQALATEYNFAVLMTNQVRRKISMGSMFEAKAISSSGIGTGFSQDDSWITTGGEALKFYLSCRYLLDFKKQYRLEVNGKKIPFGNIIQIANVKNKLAAPYSKSRFLIRFRDGVGVDDIPMIFDVLKEHKFINTKGSTYTLEATDFNKAIVGKGYAEFEKKLRENKEDVSKLYSEVWNELNDFGGNSEAHSELDVTDDIELEEDFTAEEDDEN